MVPGGGYTLLTGGAWEVVSLGPSPDGRGYFLHMRSESEEPQEVAATVACLLRPILVAINLQRQGVRGLVLTIASLDLIQRLVERLLRRSIVVDPVRIWLFYS